ncbi:DUF2273 domain-containing protein [Lactococcus fujiensis]|uniref:DUF2273 domain-containing protein n=1 Tax=Lactococcus fujiensis TaxID=610251 RepID=UPI003570CE72
MNTIIGGVSGFVLAVCFFSIGFWKTILLLLLVVLGVLIGIYLQKTDIIKQFLKK